MTEVDLKARVLALEWALKDLLRHHDAAYAMTAPGIPCGCLGTMAHASVHRAREVLGSAPATRVCAKKPESTAMPDAARELLLYAGRHPTEPVRVIRQTASAHYLVKRGLAEYVGMNCLQVTDAGWLVAKSLEVSAGKSE